MIDSHTEGEPTRVVLDGGPDLGTGPLAERCSRLARDFDHVRRRVVLEPRGFDAVVGALLCPPTRSDCATGVIFFNNEGYLGMCGHGTIGVAVTLAHLGQVEEGLLRIETPVGVVQVELDGANRATVENVPSDCYRRTVTVDVPGLGPVTGDVAWGGNWFFLVDRSPCEIVPDNAAELTAAAIQVRAALDRAGIVGREGAPIDHIEFFGPPRTLGADSRNFVLCPGGVYDRSPCGTGTSAKLACLASRGLLAPDETWVQESVIGSRFECSYRLGEGDQVIARITGRAFVCSDSTLYFHDDDPFVDGIGAA